MNERRVDGSAGVNSAGSYREYRELDIAVFGKAAGMCGGLRATAAVNRRLQTGRMMHALRIGGTAARLATVRLRESGRGKTTQAEYDCQYD